MNGNRISNPVFGASSQLTILITMKMPEYLLRVQTILLFVLLATISFTAYRVYNLESDKRELQDELIELSKVKYGLFSVDEWEDILAGIISKRINEFNLEETNEEKLREKITEFLTIAIGELEEAYKEEEGFLKRTGATLFDVFGHMERKIPEITEGIMDFMNDPENREQVKAYLIRKMNEYSEMTFSEMDYSRYSYILNKHDARDKQEAISVLHSKIGTLESRIFPYSILMYACILFSLLAALFSPGLNTSSFTLLTLICSVLLLIGLLLPMINIDARVSEISFYLLGEEIRFTDQVLYFKSKSILEVVMLMFGQKKPDVMLVGFLVLLFSVLFPLSKLISSLFYLYAEKIRSNSVIRFLVFRTAKWSMADVMVVAIFMAFIGFSGIVSEQLKDLESIALNVDMLTTNASRLQIGFFLFTSFAVLSTAVSYKLQYNFKKN